MGKPTIKTKKKQGGAGSGGKAAGGGKQGPDRTAKAAAIDSDTAFFISMAQELKDEGHKLFQKRDHEGAMLKYEKAVKLLPRSHIDVASLRSNMAACYMQLGIGEYPHAIRECNLALEVAPKYSKALLRRARCYEELNKVELALRDVSLVLGMEPGNAVGLEMAERLRKEAEKLGVRFDDKEIDLGVSGSKAAAPVKNKGLKKGVGKPESAVAENGEPVAVDKVVVESSENGDAENEKVESGEVEDEVAEYEAAENEEVKVVVENEEVKVVVEDENVSAMSKEGEAVTRAVKLVLGEDIRCAQYPANSSIGDVRDIVSDKFPSLKGILIKYKDPEGDSVTITTTEELRLAESIGNALGSFRLYVTEVSRDLEPIYEREARKSEFKSACKGGEVVSGPCIDDWVIQFAQLFKNHVGLDADPYMDFHELGMKLYAEALEDAVTTEDAQGLFEIAGEKFQEMAALAMFNWGNVHMSRARKWEPVSEDGSRESMLQQIKAAYDWAQKEYKKASQRYEEAISIKPNFYEGYLALGRQQFEQAKLAWYYAVANKVELETGPSSEVILLYNKAEDSMERGMLMWEELEERRLNGISKYDEDKVQLQKMGLDKLIQNISPDEAAEQAASMKSQIYILWGTLLYERSIVEYKLSIPVWEECLEVAVEKFELAGASPTDIAVMIKNHISNQTSVQGLGFKIDEIVQAWNEMHEAKKWQVGLPSFRLEPLFRRRIPRLHEVMEKL